MTRAARKFERVAPELQSVHDLRESNDGALWIASDLGLTRLDPAAGGTRIIATGQFATVFEDRRGNLWAGGIGARHGLHQFTATPLSNLDLDRVSGQKDVWSVTGGTDGALLVVRTNEIIRCDAEQMTRLPVSGSFRTAWIDRDGVLWAGSERGVIRWQPGSEQEMVIDSPFTGVVSAIYETGDGSLWFGGDEGLARRDGDRLVAQFPGRFEDVHCMLAGPDGTLWVGSFGGLACIDGSKVEFITREDGLSPGTVRALHLDADGVLWIGTYGGGLCRLEGSRLTRITTEQGLSDNFISAIVEDDRGRLWINSNKGPFVVHRADLNRFVAGEVRHVACVLFGLEEGAVEASGGYQPSYWIDPENRIYFPNVEGVTVVNPSVLAPTEAPPEVSITTFALDAGRRVRAEFVALGYSSPRRVRMQYRTTGSDADWIECDGRFEAQYSYLPPGGYEFQLRARNGFGPWSSVLRHPFDVPARFYESPWFMLVVIVALGAGTFRFASGRIRTARERAERFERLHAEAETAKRELDRSRADLRRLSRKLLVARDSDRRTISSELHDDVTQRIAAIAMQVGLAQRRLGQDNSVLRESLQSVADAAQQLARDVQQLSRRLHPVGLRLLGMSDAIRQECASFSKRTGTPIDLQDDVVSHDVPEDVGIAAVRIVQESLHNVEKHAHASRVEIDLRDDSGGLLLRIHDHGRGFDTADRESAGLGLISMSERAAAVGGELEIESSPSNGTTLTFRTTPKRGAR